jgi:hypothetical protein
MGLLDSKCVGCGKKYPEDNSGGATPKVGTVRCGPGFLNAEYCCGACWSAAAKNGLNISEKPAWQEWLKNVQTSGKTGKKQRAASALIKGHEIEAKIESIKVSTGPVPWNYEVEGVVFNIASDAGMFSFIKAGPDEAVKRAEAMLKLQAHERGCDAVIYTIFEHRITADKDFFGNHQQGVEIFAYGTAVRRVK